MIEYFRVKFIEKTLPFLIVHTKTHIYRKSHQLECEKGLPSDNASDFRINEMRFGILPLLSSASAPVFTHLASKRGDGGALPNKPNLLSSIPEDTEDEG